MYVNLLGSDSKATTIGYIEGLLEKYGAQWPRRTVIESFDVVTKADVARSNIKVSFDPDSGFFGSEVKGSEYELTVSEYDKIMIVTADGVFRIVAPPDGFESVQRPHQPVAQQPPAHRRTGHVQHSE